ncbi:MAG: hypothetical protein AAFN92_02220 [Bacteroidota bacterium]
MNIKSGLSQDYIDGLADDLAAALTDLECFAQAATKAKSEHDLAAAYHADLQDYCQRVSATYVRISDVYDYLDVLINHAACVGTNLNLSLEALTLLTRTMKCLCEDIEAMKADVRSLLDAIDAIDSDVLKGDGATLVKCIRDLEAEIATAVTLCCDAITALIALFRCVHELSAYVGTRDGKTMTGLVHDLQEIREVLCCAYCAGINPGIPATEPAALGKDVPSELSECCNEPEGIPDCQCDMEQPAVCEGGFTATFFTETISDRMAAIGKAVEDYKCVWQFYLKKQAGAQARHDAVKKAHEAATAAKALC